MNRFKSGVPVILLLCAGIAAAADEPTTPTAPAAAATAATATTSVSQPDKVEQARASTPSSGHPSVQRLVCLNMTLQCFAMKPKADDASAQARTAYLDLKAPDVRRVAPAILLHEPDEPIDMEQQQVEVEGTRPEVYIPGGIASLPWAVMHPTQAWRIFMPVPPGAAK
jgi:hypothetical protein